MFAQINNSYFLRSLLLLLTFEQFEQNLQHKELISLGNFQIWVLSFMVILFLLRKQWRDFNRKQKLLSLQSLSGEADQKISKSLIAN